MLDSFIVSGIVTIIVGVGGMLAYFWLSNMFLDKVLFPARANNIGRNINRANMVRPVAVPVSGDVRAGPLPRGAGVLLGVAVGHRRGRGRRRLVPAQLFEIFQNRTFRVSLLNNMLWVLVVPAASTFFGLIAAQLTDKLSWGNIAKSLIFMPMAISFVGASLIWSFVYHPDIDIGVINAIRGLFGAERA